MGTISARMIIRAHVIRSVSAARKTESQLVYAGWASCQVPIRFETEARVRSAVGLRVERPAASGPHWLRCQQG